MRAIVTQGLGAALLCAVLALAAASTGRAIAQRYLDYDEISHAHMAWLVAHGAVPYEDFATNHLPFFWLVLVPMMRALPESPTVFSLFRAAALALNLLFVFLLMANAWRGRPSAERPWIALAFLFPLFQPDVSNALIEFRPDALANPLLFAGVLGLRQNDRRSGVIATAAGALIAAALLINTKYLLLPAALAVGALFQRDHPPARLAPAALGAALAGAVALWRLHGHGINPALAFDLVFRYNWIAARQFTANPSLLQTVMAHPLPLAFAGLGLAAAMALARRGKLRWNGYLTGVMLFTLAQLLAGGKGWKHYYAAWLLLACTFPALSLAVGARLLTAPAREKLALALCAALVVAAGVRYATQSDTLLHNLADGPMEVSRAVQSRAMEFLLAHTPAGGRVVADLFWHPVFRPDTSYKVMNDVIGDADRSKETVALLPDFPYANRFDIPYYEMELRVRPPAAVLMGRAGARGIYSLYPPRQSAALRAYLDAHAAEYDYLPIPETPLLALVRRETAAAGRYSNSGSK